VSIDFGQRPVLLELLFNPMGVGYTTRTAKVSSVEFHSVGLHERRLQGRVQLSAFRLAPHRASFGNRFERSRVADTDGSVPASSEL
jgi:hypothetical protein